MAKIVIIGGGVIGSSIAYHLAQAGDASDVVVVEPDWAIAPKAMTRPERPLFTQPGSIPAAGSWPRERIVAKALRRIGLRSHNATTLCLFASANQAGGSSSAS